MVLLWLHNIIINPTNLDNFGCFPTNVISSAQDKTMAIADRCLLSIFDSSAYSGREPVKGQLISKGLLGAIFSTKKPTKIFKGFLP